jgi:tetraacyldisaccharide 4'-kinase
MNPFLLPLTLLYGAGVRLRNALYTGGVAKTRRLKQPVVSVGNLTMGGTGKTPTVIALGQMLQQDGYRLSVLLRGYKGQNRKGALLVSDGTRIRTDSGMAGDEALVLARNLPGVVVTVGKDRAEAGKWVESNYAIDAHLLDDGFQHLRLYRDLNLLLLDGASPFGGGHVPPMGRLREPIGGLCRADAILLTRVQSGQELDPLFRRLRQFNSSAPVFLSRQKLISATLADSGNVLDLNQIHTNVLAFAGIANPVQFFTSLKSAGLHLAAELCFPDHHRYSPANLRQIQRECRRLGLGTVVTTEKDAENIDMSQLASLRVLVVKVAFEFEDVDGIRNLLRGVLNKRKNQ